jgi:hypothetical protein
MVGKRNACMFLVEKHEEEIPLGNPGTNRNFKKLKETQ